MQGLARLAAAAFTMEACYTLRDKPTRMIRLSWSGSGTAMACFKEGGELLKEIGRPPSACTEPAAKYYFSPT
jgi:hypothetical protein